MVIQMLEPSRPHVIKCRNLSIRPITNDLVISKYLSWLNDNEINQYLEVRNVHSTRNSVTKYINQTRKKAGCEFFAILVDGTEHVGNINLTCFNPNCIGYAQYGLMIGDKCAQDLGIGGLASIMIAEYLFSFNEIRKIEHSVIAANERSWKTAESLGYTREGTLRQHERLLNGEYSDSFIYGMFETEWMTIRDRFSPILKSFEIVY